MSDIPYTNLMYFTRHYYTTLCRQEMKSLSSSFCLYLFAFQHKEVILSSSLTVAFIKSIVSPVSVLLRSCDILSGPRPSSYGICLYGDVLISAWAILSRLLWGVSQYSTKFTAGMGFMPCIHVGIKPGLWAWRNITCSTQLPHHWQSL